MHKNEVLIVDDEAEIRKGIRRFLEGEQFVVHEAESCQNAEKAFCKEKPDLVLLDYQLPDGNAINLIQKLKAIDAHVPLIVMTGYGTIDLAVRAMQTGAEQFFTKPIDLPALLIVFKRLLENQRHQKRELARNSRDSRHAANPFLGDSAVIQALTKQAEKIANSDHPVLILGETGAGKGVLAQWIHHHSQRLKEPFVDLNCAGLNPEFLESEIFGYEKGAYTGAVARKSGLLEVAHRGSLFLDEVGDMPASVQPKVLKVLEEKKFRKMGDVREVRVDVRFIFATHQVFQKLVEEGKFRSDLYYRISSLPLVVPSLRDRREDIPLIAKQFLEEIGRNKFEQPISLSPNALTMLTEYSWPGNIRELKNVLERAVILSEKPLIDCHDLNLSSASARESNGASPGLTLIEVEKRHIEQVLRFHHGKVADAAVALGIPKSTLYQKIKTLQIGNGKPL